MKRKTLLTIGLTIGGLLFNSTLYAQSQSSRVYYASSDSFTKVMAKNRAKRGSAGSSYVKINGNDEFEEAVKSGKIDTKINSRQRKSRFIYKEIKNVRMNKKDLKDIGDKDTLNLGLKIEEKRGSVSHGINIKNSKFKTNRKINAGVESYSKDSSDITSTSTIDSSQLIGGNR